MSKHIRLILLTLISLVAGTHLLISPETAHPLVIRGVGLVWTLEGIGYAMELYKKHLER